MNLISITTEDGDFRLIRQDPKTEIENNRGGRRVSRTPTLDGSATIQDIGYCASDLTYLVRTPDASLAPWLENLVKAHAAITIATKYGLFVGVPARWWTANNHINMEILITEGIA